MSRCLRRRKVQRLRAVSQPSSGVGALALLQRMPLPEEERASGKGMGADDHAGGGEAPSSKPLTEKEQIRADEAKNKLDRMVKVRTARHQSSIKHPTRVHRRYSTSSQKRHSWHCCFHPEVQVALRYCTTGEDGMIIEKSVSFGWAVGWLFGCRLLCSSVHSETRRRPLTHDGPDNLCGCLYAQVRVAICALVPMLGRPWCVTPLSAYEICLCSCPCLPPSQILTSWLLAALAAPHVRTVFRHMPALCNLPVSRSWVNLPSTLFVHCYTGKPMTCDFRHTQK